MSWHNMATAINASLTQCLADDTQVVLLGQDIGKTGGVFRITQGLQNQFSEQRVIDTPISETLLGGMAIGMAIAGYRPIVEFQFMGFMYSAIDHIISHASRIRNRTRGKLSCPLVYRTPFGPGVNAPEHHSESTEAMLCHTPGIRVVVPSTPFNAYHLLKQSVVSDDPVVFLEPTRLYRVRNEILNPPIPVFGKVQILLPGEDLTLITWGAMTLECLELATFYKQEFGLAIEVLDVSTLNPLDKEGLISSVRRTGRAVIVHEAMQQCGLGSEIYTLLCNELHDAGTIRRIGAKNIICPYYQNEKHYPPSKEEIMQLINEVLSHERTHF